MLSIARSEAEELNLEVIDVLKHRNGDHKVVLLCECPHRGTCVLKVLPRHLTRGRFRNHVATARIARDYDTGIFPRVFHIGRHLSLEERIEGTSLKFLPEDTWQKVDFPDFLERLHAFSRAAPPPEHVLTSAETRVLAESYLRRSFGFIHYQNARDQLISIRRLYTDQQQIRRNIELFDKLVSGVQLPAFTVLGDLTAGNVIFHRPSERLIIIDFEDITDGVLSFDCAWLLTTAARRHCPEHILLDAYRYISSRAFAASDDEIRLLRLLLKMLLENDLRIIRTGMSNTHRLLQVVEADIKHDTEPAFA